MPADGRWDLTRRLKGQCSEDVSTFGAIRLLVDETVNH
jgi:hypothetical protein